MEGVSTIGSPTGGLLDRSRTIAGPGFNRWLVPPCALAIHLCIGMIYGFSVFWLPLTQLLGNDPATKAPPDVSTLNMLFTQTLNWRLQDVTIVFTLAIVFLGLAAAVWGGWLERVGPRKAGFYAAICWAGGLMLSGLAIYIHQLWLFWLGAGVIGGIGLGLGYISPVSTLIKWFPDRRGMATGMAIMGFGGGAMIGSPLAVYLMNDFGAGVAAHGVWQTFVALGVIYAVFMCGGAFGYRLPPAADWAPEGWTATAHRGRMITTQNVHLRDAHKTPQFWLIWFVLMLNVSAGIGVLAVASPMLQFLFGGSLIGAPGLRLPQLNPDQVKQVALIAAGFVSLLSLFNSLGRFFWASISDGIGRKSTYAIFFLLGVVLYAGSPWTAQIGSVSLFVIAMCIILSMYGGGFATVPAYLADMFGTQYVGAIHGRLLTAWSTAGVVGPITITRIPEILQERGVSRGEAYGETLYILAGFLVIGFFCNLFVRPVAERWFMRDGARQPAASPITPAAAPVGPAGAARAASHGIGRGGFTPAAAIAWALVGIPLLWGIWITVSKAFALFA